jgi:hypothetical protein
MTDHIVDNEEFYVDYEQGILTLNIVIALLKKSIENLRHPEIIRSLSYHGRDRVGRFFVSDILREGTGLNNIHEIWAIVDDEEDIIPPRLTFADLANVAEEKETRRLVEDLLPYNGLSIIGSEPKVGKSSIIKNLIAAVINHSPWLGRKTYPQSGKVVYYVLEEVATEVYGDLVMLGITDDTLLSIRRGRIGAVTFVRTLAQDIQDIQPDLVVIDPLIDILNTSMINDYGLTNKALKDLVALARNSNAHIIATHHTTKSGGANEARSYLGSIALPGATDCNLTLSKRSDGTRIIAAETRYRTDRDIEATVLEYDPDTGKVWLGDPVEDMHEVQRAKLEEDLKRIQEALAPDKMLSRRELEEITGLSQKRVEKLLAEGKKHNTIKSVGQGHLSRYALM